MTPLVLMGTLVGSALLLLFLLRPGVARPAAVWGLSALLPLLAALAIALRGQ